MQSFSQVFLIFESKHNGMLHDSPLKQVSISAFKHKITCNACSFQILGFYGPNLDHGYEARCSGGIQINFDHLEIVSVCRKLDTAVFAFRNICRFRILVTFQQCHPFPPLKDRDVTLLAETEDIH